MRGAGRNIGRKVLLGFVIVLGVMWIGSIRRPSPPRLAADCTRAGFLLSTESIPQTKVVSFTIVGPAGRRLALAVDARTLDRGADGRFDTLVAVPGREADVLLPAPDEPMPQACIRSGFFATPIAVGKHTVTLYEVTDTGVRALIERPLEVTAPQPGFALRETR